MALTLSTIKTEKDTDSLRVSVENFNGYINVSIRHWITYHNTGKTIPTKKGINIAYKKAVFLLDKINEQESGDMTTQNSKFTVEFLTDGGILLVNSYGKVTAESKSFTLSPEEVDALRQGTEYLKGAMITLLEDNKSR